MNEVEVRYQGDTVGVLNSQIGEILFEFDKNFLELGLELSPFYLKTALGIIESQSPFEEKLPGVFYDSLPDHWGRQVMKQRLRLLGLNPERMAPLTLLSLVGEGGMGALTYHPQHLESDTWEVLDLVDASRLARGIIKEDTELMPSSEKLLHVASNPGGRFPKLQVSMNADKTEIIFGGKEFEQGFSYWLLKLDVEGYTAKHAGRMEYAYSLMAREAGIRMAETCLVQGRDQAGEDYAHFATKRFDRKNDKKIHIHTYSGIANQLAVRYGTTYEDLLGLCFALTQDHREVEEGFRRMVFNVLAGNRDDHVRNHAFMMLEDGSWCLSPAYDLTRTYGDEHCLGINNKWRAADMGDIDFLAVAQKLSIRKESSANIITQVREAVGEWDTFAEQAGLPANALPT